MYGNYNCMYMYVYCYLIWLWLYYNVIQHNYIYRINMKFTQNINLKIASWNVQGINRDAKTNLDKWNDIKKEISKFDIFAIQETHLCPGQSLSCSGYATFQKQRDKDPKAPYHSGGIAVFIKQTIIDGISSLNSECNDLMWFKLKKEFFNLTNDIFLCFAYISPSNSSYLKKMNVTTLDILKEDIVTYHMKGKILIMGDLNARTQCKLDYIQDDDTKFPDVQINYNCDSQILPVRSNKDTILNDQGKELLDLCIESSMRILNGRKLGDLNGNYTCFKYNGKSSIDYALVQEDIFNEVIYFKVHDFLGDLSDHCQISLGIKSQFKTSDLSCSKNKEPSKLPDKYKWNPESATAFKLALSAPQIQSLINKYINTTFINSENAVESFNNIIEKTCKLAEIKKHKSKFSNPKNIKSAVWFNQNCIKLKQSVRQLGKKLCHDPKNSYLQTAFHAERKKYKKYTKYCKHSFKQEICDKLNSMEENDPKAYWKLIDKLTKCDKENQDSESSIKEKDWYNYYKQLLNTSNCNNTCNNYIENKIHKLENIPTFSKIDFPIKKEEIQKQIINAKNNKTPGLDCFINEMFKSGYSNISGILVKLFNSIFSSGNFPQNWNKGYIIPLFKSGDRSKPSNYRGITINNHLSKIFTSVLNNRLTEYLEENNILEKNQIGFKKKSRTTDHLFVIKTIMDKIKNKKCKELYACFVDFKKAFDTIWHKGLLFKLLKNGIAGPFYHIIKSMYANVFSSVKCKSGITEYFQCFIGVKQGDSISPTLFNLYINDLMNNLDNDFAPIIDDTKINCLQFADDLIIFSHSKIELQQNLNKLNEYCTEWKLQINTDKTKVMKLSNHGRISNDKFYINNNDIEIVREYKYLGIMLTSSCQFTTSQNALLKKSNKACFKLKSMIRNCMVSPKIQLKLYDQLISPILLYGSEIWGIQKIKDKSIEIADNNNLYDIFDKAIAEKSHISFLRSILGTKKSSCKSAIRGELGRYPLQLNIWISVLKFINHIYQQSEDSFVYKAFNEQKLMMNNNCWLMHVTKFCKTFDINFNFNTINNKSIINKIKQKLRMLYERQWLNHIQNNKKLNNFYSKFKVNIIYESYLDDIKSIKQRKCLTRFRISAHNLHIETGRHNVNKIERNQRTCKLCPREIEDEFHFLMNCKIYEKKRKDFFENITVICPNFANLSEHDKLLYLLTGENEISKLLAKFCAESFQDRDLLGKV